MEVETAGTQLPKDLQPTSPSQNKASENKDVYSVEKILDRKIENGQKLYLIKWEGYPTSESTWEPVENLLNVIDIIVDYEVRECTKQEEKENDKTEGSPKTDGKRKAERSLSEEGDLVKKVKGDSKDLRKRTQRKPSYDEEDEDDEDDDDDDDEEEKETMQDKLKRRKKALARLKAFQGKEFSDKEAFVAASNKINMTHPFVVEAVKSEDIEDYSESDESDYSDVPKKRGRGRPRKTDVAREQKGIKKRGRPRKIQTSQDNEDDIPIKKRGPGRPKKATEEGEENKEEDGTEKAEKDEKDENVPKKRGRPKKNVTEEGEESAPREPKRRGRPRKHENYAEEESDLSEDDDKDEEENKEKGDEAEKGDQEPKEPKGEKKRGRPRKPVEEGEASKEPKEPRKRGRPRKERHDEENDLSEGKEEEDTEEKVEKAEKDENDQKEEGVEKMTTEEKQGEEKDEKTEETQVEGASPTALAKARTEAVLKKRGVITTGHLNTEHGTTATEGVVKRGRGRPKKVVAPVAEEGENEKTEQKKEGEEGEEEKEKEDLKSDKEGGEEEEASNAEEGDEESPPVRKRGRPKKSEVRKRGRPRKVVRTQMEEEDPSGEKEASEGEEEGEGEAEGENEGEGEEGRAGEPAVRKRGRPRKSEVRKRGRPRKVVPDVNKENDYQAGFAKGEQEDQAGTSILGVRSEQGNETETQQKKQGQAATAHKFGSLNEKDIPKRIIKARVVTDKGCIFLIEWEKRPNGDQPQNSHVTSHELKNFDTTFLLEYYEEILKKNIKNRKATPDVEPAPRDDDMIPVEQDPELFGSFAFHDNPKEIVKVKAATDDGWEFLVRWEPRANNIQPLDSVVNNEALKLHDPNFLISFYETKIKSKAGEESLIALDLLDQVEDKKPDQEDSSKNIPAITEDPANNAETSQQEGAVNETAMQQESVTQG